MRSSILIVEDNDLTRQVLRRRLEDRGFAVIEATGGEEALGILNDQAVDLVLLDILMPERDGLEVLAEVRRRHPPTDLPVVMLTVKEASANVVEALKRGANDYVTKAEDFTVILARIETQLTLHRLMVQVQELAVRDPLTGLYNRRGFYELAEREEARARRYGSRLQALMVDVDHFKRINDTLGHKIGDRVLAATAGCCRDHLRSCDILGRWGGEEFAALLPGVDLEGAVKSAERLAGGVASHRVETTAGDVGVTVSVGVASYDASCRSLGDLLSHVDLALYQAKRGGRNRVSAFGA